MLPAPPDFATTGFHPPDAAPGLPGYPSSSYLFGSAASGNAEQNAAAQHLHQQQQQPQQQASSQQAQGSEALNAVHLQYYQMQRAQVRSPLCELLTVPTGSLWLSKFCLHRLLSSATPACMALQAILGRFATIDIL